MAEYGVIAPQGPVHVERLTAYIKDPGSSLPPSARACLQVLVDTLRSLRERIDRLDAEIAARAKQDNAARRLMTIPRIGPLLATATSHDVGTVLLRRMPGLFFSVIFRRSKKRHSVEIATSSPC